MSRAFTKEDEGGDALGGIGERPISSHRNLVTRCGLEKLEAEIARLRDELARIGPSTDRERFALLSRDLRYWTARRETAEIVMPDWNSEVIRFGMRVSVEDEDGVRKTWTIVGEDEADAACGTVSHVSPLAQALFGKRVGEAAIVNGKAWEVVAIGVEE
ncbi:MAG TPA: GreA/GreB family elongation factor [Mesorhizobium sp.]|jgi:transcription elongation GreA/GreB family factor|nr:GreA/GreB family elongation factor [Mesorhizobium sp.]